MDRNWAELLQELRVTQTGTQILTAFLLTIAFQPAFGRLDDFERTVTRPGTPCALRRCCKPTATTDAKQQFTPATGPHDLWSES